MSISPEQRTDTTALPPYPHNKKDTVVPAPEHRDDKNDRRNIGWRKPAAAGALVLATVAGAFGVGKAMGGETNNSPEPNTEPSVGAPAVPGEVIIDSNVIPNFTPPADSAELASIIGATFDEDTMRELAYQDRAMQETEYIMNHPMDGERYSEFLHNQHGLDFLDKDYIDSIYTKQVTAESKIFSDPTLWNDPEAADAILGELPFITNADLSDALNTGDHTTLVKKLLGLSSNNVYRAQSLLISQLQAGEVNPELRDAIIEYASLGTIDEVGISQVREALEETERKFVESDGKELYFDPLSPDTTITEGLVLSSSAYSLTDYPEGPAATELTLYTESVNSLKTYRIAYKVVLIPAPVQSGSTGVAVQGVVVNKLILNYQ